MKKVLKVNLFLVIFFLIVIISPYELFSENWLKVEITEDEMIWVDNSHWEYKKILVKDGYYKEVKRNKWVDTSYIIKQGYWKVGQYSVWVPSKTIVSYTAYRYVNTSHYERRYRDVTIWIPTYFTVIIGTNQYGWDVYAFAAKPAGLKRVSYKGNIYWAEKWVINYKPYRGGRIYAEKWVFRSKLITYREYYNVWINSGYWQPYTAYKVVDNSHWETKVGKYWVDTSYKVERGYWEEYIVKEWVDTSYYEHKKIFVRDGYYVPPLHGEVVVEKSPKYVFTKWHKNARGEECNMELKVTWSLDNSEISPGEEEKKINSIYIYENVCRFENNGIDKVIIYNDSVPASAKGSIDTIIKFNYSGGEDSILHIYLYAQSGESAHIYFSNPINGYRSINISSNGSSSNANTWLGGNYCGKVEF